MMKKSLFFGTAALVLLVLLTVASCSSPTSGSTEYVTQAGSDYPYPADTVFVADRAALDGLLNDYTAETNQVRNIAYRGDSASLGTDLIIPAGKTVYLTEDHTSIDGNITVREGAKLVLVGNFIAGAGTHPITSDPNGFLLVRGTVEVFGSLTVTQDALDVADYSVENDINPGRNTVIGKNVTVLPGAVLILATDDLIPPTESQPNKFTPAQAWAAAGQGHLVIGNNGSLPGAPESAYADALLAYNYTVSELLNGVRPSLNRTYTVTSGRITPEELPAEIYQGAFILTRATPTRSVGNTLTVNGYLATNGTLNEITNITVGNGGLLVLTEPNGELLTGLKDLKLGPGAGLAVHDDLTFGTTPTNDDVSLNSLETLFLGDGSTIFVQGGNVTFKEDKDLALTMGKNITYQVAMSASAKVNTVIAKDASLVNGSDLIVYPGSTFTLNEGVTFGVDGTSTFDISRQPIPPPADTVPITINGTIEIAEGGDFIGPDFATVQANPENLFKTIGLGSTGKMVLNYGANFSFAPGSSTAKYVGDNGDGAPYEWDTADKGAQIEINSQGLIIRDITDIDPADPVIVSVNGQGAGILKNHSLTLARGVVLQVTTGEGLFLFGDTAANGGGAKLLGPGQLVVGTGTLADQTIIVGGDYGWQAIGHDVAIFAKNGSSPPSPTLAAFTLPSATPPPTLETTFKALGLGATITVGTDNLIIGNDVTIDLNGSNARKAGEIILPKTKTITLGDDGSKIITGAGPAGHPSAAGLASNNTSSVSTALDTIGILGLTGNNSGGGTPTYYVKAFTTAAPVVTPTASLLAGQLVSLAGNASPAAVITNNHATDPVSISSETPTVALP
ncbi:MAG: hypothetical protein LBO65_03195 [Spirochaetaceae bacterium]|jgi:hypothetical protein|nr:hypothetical protein [Spirochaetaceae bacterium]